MREFAAENFGGDAGFANLQDCDINVTRTSAATSQGLTEDTPIAAWAADVVRQRLIDVCADRL